MSTKPRLLFVGDSDGDQHKILASLSKLCEVTRADTSLQAMKQVEQDGFEGLYIAAHGADGSLETKRLIQNESLIQALPDGLVLLDVDNTILWANQEFRGWCSQIVENREEAAKKESGASSENIASTEKATAETESGSLGDLSGKNFYSALGGPEILGPDYCPFHTALAAGSPSSSTLRTDDNRYYQIHVAPILDETIPSSRLVVAARDVTNEMLQQQKLAAIHRAGVELSDMTPEILSQMTVEERIELLKTNILHHTKDLLRFDVVEIRLLDQKTGKLEPLLSFGIEEEAARRDLYAKPLKNGVTGFVAATGKSYLCEDTSEDPLYLEGCQDAKSSLTVPLVMHDQVVGTFNVESPEPLAFAETDLQFLEVFSRDVAASINTLELLVAEHAIVAAESIEAIHSAVALPVDDILNDVVNVMEHYIGHSPEVVQRLQRILRNTRDIKQVIQKVGQKMTPSQARPDGLSGPKRPRLFGMRILVADADESVRSAAHALLERYGCIVETAHDGVECIGMVRNTSSEEEYDAIIADIRLPDVSGYDLCLQLFEMVPSVPLILMTGFGYDPGHSIVKARQAGVQEILFKPFRLDQLLETVERVVSASE